MKPNPTPHTDAPQTTPDPNRTPAQRQADLIAHADEGMERLLRELETDKLPTRLLADLAHDLARSGHATACLKQNRVVVVLSHEAARVLALSAGIVFDLSEARKLEAPGAPS